MPPPKNSAVLMLTALALVSYPSSHFIQSQNSKIKQASQVVLEVKNTAANAGHPRCSSRIYPRFLPQLEKTHETFASLRDEARFPGIVSRAIAFSQSNTPVVWK